jgi:hypothetical protein
MTGETISPLSGAIDVFLMTWGLRRLAFTLGAVLLIGGWGLTGFIDAHQHAAGADAGLWWRNGMQETTATLRPSVPAWTEGVPLASAGLAITDQITPPSSWLYLLGVVSMTAGGGLMALTVPWRGERRTAAVTMPAPAMTAGIALPQPPPPPPAAPKAAPKAAPPPSAPLQPSSSLPSSLPEAATLAPAAVQPPKPAKPAKTKGKSAAKGKQPAMKPLIFKRGA